MDRLEELLLTLRPARAYPERLLGEHEGTVVVVLAHVIDWIKATDNYGDREPVAGEVFGSPDRR